MLFLAAKRYATVQKSQMKKALLTILCLIFVVSIFGQIDTTSLLWIRGNVRVKVGGKIVIPNDAIIELRCSNKILFSDSHGSFNFESLKPGKYNFRVLGIGNNTFDTVLSLEKVPINDLILVVSSNCSVNELVAENDIKKGKCRLLLVGSISPIANSKQDEFFQSKYKVTYFDFGCNIQAIDCIIQYNEKMFEYFDNTFGLQWRAEVRKDVIGLKE